MKRILGILVALTMVVSVLGAGFSALAGGTGPGYPTLTELSGGWWVEKDNPTILWAYTGNATNVVIPNGITEIASVTALSNWYNEYSYDNITSISIHSGVTSIGQREKYIFAGCSSLKQITVNSNNANYVSVDGVLFNKNKTALVCYPEGKTASAYTIPSSVKTIWIAAFYGCTSLVSVNIPNGVTDIGWSAFAFCSSLENLNIPNGVEAIGGNTFYGCTSLKSVNIPNSVKTIGMSAFFRCSSLKSVSIPYGVTVLEDSTFLYCSSLEVVNIPNSVTYIEDDVFRGCSSLKSLYIPASVTKIGRLMMAMPAWLFDEATTLKVIEGSYAHKWAVEREHPYTLFFVSEIADMKDVFDVMTLAISGLELSAEQIAVADLNKDGKVDAVDTLAALKIVLGL